MPVVLAGTALALATASPALSQSMPLINPPGLGALGQIDSPSVSPGTSPNRQAAAPSQGPGPAYQGAPRSLLPPSEPSEFNSFNPQRRQEASADPEATPSVVAPNLAPATAGPVAIPVQDSGEPAGSAPAVTVSAAAAAATELKASPRQRGRSVIPVTMDQAVVVRAPHNIRTMILGNPLIADVATQKGGLIVVTGKMYGSTNLVLVDAKGEIIGESMIQVQPPKVDVVTVQLGLQRQSYSCTPLCQPTVVVGNDQAWFSSAQGQAQQRSQGMKASQ